MKNYQRIIRITHFFTMKITNKQ